MGFLLKNPFSAIFKRGVSDPWHWIVSRAVLNNKSSAGVNVSADNALNVSVVYACVKRLSETLASLPLMLYERVGDGKQPAVNHPLYSVLHESPNDYMTSFELRELIVTHINLRGNAFCVKSMNNRGIIESLIPLNPANMSVSRSNGLLVYEYTYEDGRTETFAPDRIWHLKNLPISCLQNGAPPEGILGVSPISLARESIGLSLAADEYGSRYFANNATVGMNLSFPGKLSENAKKFLKESLAEYAKSENRFKSIITEEGGKIDPLSITNEDSQFLESRQFQIEEIARIFGVPPVLIGHPTNTMTYASAEQLFLSFATFTIAPWCKRLEQSMNKYLLSDAEQKRYFFEHVMAGLLRGDTASRFQAYSVARQWGWMNVDEIRALENMNPLPDEKGQVYLQPMNMTEAGAEPPPAKEPGFVPKKGNGKFKLEGEEEGVGNA
jgi:HK97 family phage portal protein